MLADSLTNNGFEEDKRKEYTHIHQLPSICRKHLLIDKMQLGNLRIKTSKIKKRSIQ